MPDRHVTDHQMRLFMKHRMTDPTPVNERLSEAMTLAARIVLLIAGQVEQVGAPLDLYERPDSRFVAGFIGRPTGAPR